jgi:hypothetical protein
VNTAELGQPARRPLDAGMDSSRAAAVLGRQLLDFQSGLRAWASERRTP